MATITMTVDDIDGTPDARTIHFALEGVDYAIDLSDTNHARMVDALGPFIEVARRQAGGRLRAGNARRAAAVPRGAVTPPARRAYVDAPEFSSAPTIPRVPSPSKPVSSPPAPKPTPTRSVLPPSAPPAVIRAWWKDADCEALDIPPWRAKGVIPATVITAWQSRINGAMTPELAGDVL